MAKETLPNHGETTAGEQLLTELLEKRKVLLDAMYDDTEAADDEYLIVCLQKVHTTIKLVWELIDAERQGDKEAYVKKILEIEENFRRTEQEITQLLREEATTPQEKLLSMMDWPQRLEIS